MAYASSAELYEQQVDVAHWLIYSINAAEDFVLCHVTCGDRLTLIMQYSRKRIRRVRDFTFQGRLWRLLSGVLYTLSGMLGDALGYANYLLLICVVAILCLVTDLEMGKASKSAQLIPTLE